MALKIKGTLGTMSFRGFDESWVFMRKIEAWAGFSVHPPINREEAVDYQLTFERGGIPAVLELEQALYAQALAAKRREMAIALEVKMEKEHRYAMARLAPRDSEEYRIHFDSWHPGFKWGS